jgi:hypothetical protein
MDKNAKIPLISADERKKRNQFMFLVLGVLFGLSLLLGYQAFSNYVLSEKSLKSAHQEFVEIGKTSTPHECVKKALGWLPKCEGLYSLCEQIVPELMTTCLSQQPRNADCTNMAPEFRSTRYGAKECALLGVSKQYKKSCGLAFRQIDNYCYGLKKKMSL